LPLFLEIPETLSSHGMNFKDGQGEVTEIVES